MGATLFPLGEVRRPYLKALVGSFEIWCLRFCDIDQIWSQNGFDPIKIFILVRAWGNNYPLDGEFIKKNVDILPR